MASPRDSTLHNGAQSVPAGPSATVERRVLERALLAEELAIFVFLWPPYAEYNSPPGISGVRRRAHQLAARWFDTADEEALLR